MLKKIFKNNIILTFLISIIVFGIIYIFSLVFTNIDRSLSDRLYSIFVSKNLKISDKLVMVLIDDESIKKIGKFPFKRDVYIPVIENLNKSGVSVIGMDIIFSDESNKSIDKKYADALKKANNVIIGGASNINKDGKHIFSKPLDIIEKSVFGYGFFEPIYKSNRKAYSINTYKNYNNGRFFHFSIELYRAYLSKLYGKNYLDYFKKDKNYFYLTENLKIPAVNGKEFYINFVSKNNPQKFYTISFADLLDKNYINNNLRDKIVIIGYTAKGIKDIFEGPEGQQFGVYTHANSINTIITKQFKIYFDKNIEYLLLFLLILGSVYFNLSQRGKALIISNISILSIFLLIIWIIYDGTERPLNFPAEFIFALIITLTISNILKSYLEDKNKTLLNKALSQYVSKDIADEILSGEGKVKLDGERKRISIFFSDIEGFTSISEKMNPEELVVFLREYLGAMSNIIMDQHGFIDKYEGDAIMALWGVFGYEKTSSYDNCVSAINQQEKLKILNKDWKIRFGEELKIRMGLHTGEAIVGNIGATGRKMEYTALGDSVNLASRLEEVNKKYGTYLCVSEVIYQEQKDNFEFRYLDQIKVKGKEIPVKIYELFSKKGEITQSQKNIINNFEKAIKLYLEKDFQNALKIFEELSILGDNPSKTYIKRCEIFIENPPLKDWDGVWTMKTK